ncbi:hypothetical protein CsatA_027055 [Cannabis sativa]
MHYDCTPPIVHRDITTTNILLNSEFEAFVSDYGTARLLDPDSSNQTMIAGTYGYIAPASSSSIQHTLLSDIIDNRPSAPRNRLIEGDIVLIAMLGFACLNAKPNCRPTMKLVSHQLLAPKTLLAKRFSDVSLMFPTEISLNVQNYDLHSIQEIQ